MPNRNLLAAVVAVAAAFVIALTLGFQIHDSMPGISDEVLGSCVALSIFGIAFAIFALLAAPGTFRRRRRAVSAKPEAPVRPRKVEPIPQPSAPRIPQRSGEQIAYDQNVNMTATCPHLKPIEHAIRMAGIATHLMTASFEEHFAPLARVQADGRINLDALKLQFPFPDSVQYTEGYRPERSQYDNPWATLACSDCRSAIELVHPEWPRQTTQWFPSAP